MRGLRTVAARHSRVSHEVDDLVQDVLLAAIVHGKSTSDTNFMAWAAGVIRLRARFLARTAARRGSRERAYATLTTTRQNPKLRLPKAFIESLPQSRRVVAHLVNLGMGRREIAYLLNLTDVAMRQRLSGLRRAMLDSGVEPQPVAERAIEAQPGLMRRDLKTTIPPLKIRQFAIRDPDGMAIFISAGHVPDVRGN